MESAATLSAGVVVVRGQHNRLRFLLLRAYRHWDFPKGVIERDEMPIDAARREVREETGLGDLHFRWGEIFIDTEPYGRGKVARYFLAQSDRDEVQLVINPQIGRPEHDQFRWLGYNVARSLLNERLTRVLDWAASVIGVTGEDRTSGAR